MEDIKNAIAAADIAVTDGRKPTTASLIELFRALRKSKVPWNRKHFTLRETRLTPWTIISTSQIQRPDILAKYGRQLIQSGTVGGIEGDQKINFPNAICRIVSL